jgi:hypothetical protein
LAIDKPILIFKAAKLLILIQFSKNAAYYSEFKKERGCDFQMIENKVIINSGVK